jgi:hypothetical protein
MPKYKEYSAFSAAVSAEVKAAHSPMSSPSDISATRIKGYFVNLYRRAKTSQGPHAFRAVGAAVSWVPVAGTITSYALGKFGESLLKTELGEKITGDPAKRSAEGELLATSFFQHYVDAVRKLDEAESEWNEVAKEVPQNCAELHAYLTTLYHFKHRINRLEDYHRQISSYVNAIEKELPQRKSKLDTFEKQFGGQAGIWFNDVTHHGDCKECYKEIQIIKAPPPPFVKRPPPPPLPKPAK